MFDYALVGYICMPFSGCQPPLQIRIRGELTGVAKLPTWWYEHLGWQLVLTTFWNIILTVGLCTLQRQGLGADMLEWWQCASRVVDGMYG